MGSRNGADSAAAAAVPPSLPRFPHALLSLPDLDRPPALLEMWQVEAIAAALPAKKKRLQETFERLAACSPGPLPFRWEDLDTYICSLQYSVTLRFRELRALDESRRRDAAPAPTAAVAAAAIPAPDAAGRDDLRQPRAPEQSGPVPAPAPYPAAVSVPAATASDVRQPRTAEKSRTVVHAPVPTPPADAVPQQRTVEMSRPVVHTPAGIPATLSAPAAIANDVHQQRTVDKSRPVTNAPAGVPLFTPTPAAIATDAHQEQIVEKSRPIDPPAPPAVRVPVPDPGADSGPAATRADINGKKRKAPSQQTADVSTQEETRKFNDDVAKNKKQASPVQDVDGKKSSPSPPVNGKIAVTQQELSAHRDAPNFRSAPRSGAAATAVAEPAVAGGGIEKGKKRKVSSEEAEAADMHKQMQDAAVQEDTRKVRQDSALQRGEAKVSPFPPGSSTLPSMDVTLAMQVLPIPIGKIVGVPAPTPRISNATGLVTAASPADSANVTSLSSLLKVPKQEVPDVEMEEVAPPEDMQAVNEEAPAPLPNKKESPLQAKAQVSPLPLGCGDHGLAEAGGAIMGTAGGTQQHPPAVVRDAPNLVRGSAPKCDGGSVRRESPAAKAHGDADAATDLAPAATPNAGTVRSSPAPPRGASSVPPCGGSGGLARPDESTAAAVRTDDARRSAVVEHGFPAAMQRHRGQSATDLAPASGQKATGPLQAKAPPNTGNHVLQKQHMAEPQGYGCDEPVSLAHRQNGLSFPRNHGGRPMSSGSQPPPEAKPAAQRLWNKNKNGGYGSSSPDRGGRPAGRGWQGDDSRQYKGKAKGKPTLFCNKCGCKGHLSEDCRTAKHLVALYQKDKMQREDNQICYRCGSTGHWSRRCHTPKHLVDLYQKDRAAKQACNGLQSNNIN